MFGAAHAELVPITDTLKYSLMLKYGEVQDVKEIELWLRVTKIGPFAHATARAITSEASQCQGPPL